MKMPVIVLAATLVFSSCQKSSTPNPVNSTLQFQLKAANTLVVINRTTAPGSILWTSGSASATDVKLEAKKDTSHLEFNSSGVQQIDLFASVLTSLGNVIIPAGTYTELEFKIELGQNGSNPSMVLNGTYTSGTGVVTPVQFTLNNSFELKAEQSNLVVTGTNAEALTTLDLSFISTGITQAMMNSATVTSGKILITASSNTGLYNIMVNNLSQFHHVDVTHH